MNILLMGYYGQRNIGDDLFVKQLIKYFSRQKNINQIFIFCKNNYYDIRNNKVIFFEADQLSKLKKVAIIFQTDCIAWGGGTLNLDSKPLNLLRLQALSKLMGKRFCFLGIGLETFDSGNEEGIAEVFEQADLLYVRDKHSYDLAEKNLKSSQSRCLGGDLAFLDLSVYEAFINKNKKSTHISNLSFSGKFWWGDGRAKFYSQQLLPLIEKFNTAIHLLPAHVGDIRNDNRFHQLLKKYLPEKNCQLHSWENPEDFLKILSQMDFHMGNRLHSLVLADILGVANMGIGESSKIENYIKKTKMLADERLLKFMEPINIIRVENILEKYERPKKFINIESKTSQKCLELIFTK